MIQKFRKNISRGSILLLVVTFLLALTLDACSAKSMAISSTELSQATVEPTLLLSTATMVLPADVSYSTPTPPVPTKTSQTGACLTLEKWNQLAVQNDPLPSGLGGKLLTTVDEGDGANLPTIYLGGLDGANLQKMDIGAWPSLSSDGSRLIYMAADNLYVVDLASGQRSTPGLDGYYFVWSPDDSRIMYTTMSDLFIANADGSDVRKVDTGPAKVISPVGWLPDNQTIVYSAMNGSGFDYKSYNLQSSKKADLFTVVSKAGFGAISPDGQWIVFMDLFNTPPGMFISRLDGTARKWIAESQVPASFNSVWSPDGQWLVLNTQNLDGIQIPLLVNPFTCQMVHLGNVKGVVVGWSPK